MINIDDFKEYWGEEIARGKYQGLLLEVDYLPSIKRQVKILRIYTPNNQGSYLIEWGSFDGFNVNMNLLINKGVINDYTEYDEDKVLSREYYDDLISYILDSMIEGITDEYHEVTKKYKEISTVVKTSGLNHEWSEELYGKEET